MNVQLLRSIKFNVPMDHDDCSTITWVRMAIQITVAAKYVV